LSSFPLPFHPRLVAFTRRLSSILDIPVSGTHAAWVFGYLGNETARSRAPLFGSRRADR
jgi:hypothetical protein